MISERKKNKVYSLISEAVTQARIDVGLLAENKSVPYEKVDKILYDLSVDMPEKVIKLL